MKVAKALITVALSAALAVSGSMGASAATVEEADAGAASHPYKGIGTSVGFNQNGPGHWISIVRDQKQKIYHMDGAPQFSPVSDPAFVAAQVVAKPKGAGEGYWLVYPDGKIKNQGPGGDLNCTSLSLCTSFELGGADQVVAAAATPTGKGLFVLGKEGQLWTVGDAKFYGSAFGKVGYMASAIGVTPSGKGYVITAEDGGVFTFGDAQFFGSTGGKKINGEPVTGLVMAADGQKQLGYWLISSWGDVSGFGVNALSNRSNIDLSGDDWVANAISIPGGYAIVQTHGKVSQFTGPTS